MYKAFEIVNMLYGVIRRAGAEKTKEWDYWCDEQCKGEKREVIMALKECKKRNDEKGRSRCSCRRNM